jgi:hypothetical protein
MTTNKLYESQSNLVSFLKDGCWGGGEIIHFTKNIFRDNLQLLLVIYFAQIHFKRKVRYHKF